MDEHDIREAIKEQTNNMNTGSDTRPQPKDIRRILGHLELGKRINTINERLTSIDRIAATDDPTRALFDIITEIMPDLCERLDADRAILLRPLPNITSGYRVAVQHPEPSSPDHTTYNIHPDKWRFLGQGKGIAFVQVEPNDVTRPLLDLPIGSSQAHLPAESVIIRVGKADNPARFMLIITGVRTGKKKELTYQNMAEVFDLLHQRLNDVYNLALHREREIAYDRDRSEFLQDVMHQLIGLLSGMSANVENLIGGREVNPQEAYQHLRDLIIMQQKYAQTCVLAADKRSILEVYNTPFEYLDASQLLEVLRKQCGAFEGRAKLYGIDGPHIDFASFDNFPVLHIQRRLFELVIFNLLDNAIKYCAHEKNAPIVVRGDYRGNVATITVTNHGLPLSADEATKIFDRYMRSRSATTQVPDGTGMGLYICRKIIQETHNGKIVATPSVPSEIVPGAHRVTFKITLPPAHSNANLSESAAQPQQETHLPKLLYVEDDVWQHEGRIKGLRYYFDVVLARTGEKALELLQTDPNIQLVLLDIRLNLGQMQTHARFAGTVGGVELAKAILQELRYSVPIICYTASPDAKMIQDLEKIGVKRVLDRGTVNDIDMNELVSIIKEHMTPGQAGV